MALALTVLAHEPAAQACDCNVRAPSVFPGPDVAAPLNTRVWIFDAPAAGAISLQLDGRDVPTTMAGYTVPDDRGEGFRQDQIQRVRTVQPLQELKPRTRYDVVLTTDRPPAKTLGSITTGDVADHEPPSWSGPVSVQVEEQAYGPAACKIGMPHALVSLGAPRDNHTPKDALLISASAAIVGATFPALTSLHRLRSTANGHFVMLRGGTLCDPRDFDFPAPLEKAELVLRAVDLAGNASSEHKQPLVGPLSAHDRELLQRAGKLEAVRAGAKGADDASRVVLWLALGLGALGLVVALVVLREQ